MWGVCGRGVNLDWVKGWGRVNRNGRVGVECVGK